MPIRHQSICRCIDEWHTVLGSGAQDHFIQLAALTFDFSIGEIFLAWKSGGCLCVPSTSQALLPHDFARRRDITVWSSVPSVVANLLASEALPAGSLPSLRISYFFGDALPGAVAVGWSRAAPNSRIYNLYGPTETAVFSTWYRLETCVPGDAEPILPIGEPFDGLDCVLIDQHGGVISQPDTAGELLLSGIQVFDGYWDDPGTSDRAFMCLPEGDRSERRWYRTGDMAAWGRDGKLRFRGRTDRQIKLRGLRVELQRVPNSRGHAARPVPIVAWPISSAFIVAT